MSAADAVGSVDVSLLSVTSAVIAGVNAVSGHPADLDDQAEDDILSDLGEYDRACLAQTALSQQHKKELLAVASSFTSASASTPSRGRGRPPKTPQAEPLAHMGVNEAMVPMQMQMQMPMFQPPESNVQMPVVAVNAPPQLAPLSAPPLPPCPWFDPSSVGEEEVRELGPFFPAIRNFHPSDLNGVAYLQLRNTLIDVYRVRPQTRLTLAECRKHCDGDLSALLRMLSFLERNRLINYALDPNEAPNGPGDPATKKLKDDLREHWTRTPTCAACDRICLYSFFVLSPSVYGSNLPMPHLRTALWCADCAREAPHNQCLLKVNLPALHVAGGASSWSEQQINALFDAIETHGCDWINICKTVSAVPGNPVRTPRECLAAFLSMPLAELPSCLQNNISTLSSTRDVTAADSPVTIERTPTDPAVDLAASQLLLTALDVLSQQGASQLNECFQSMALNAQHKIQAANNVDNLMS